MQLFITDVRSAQRTGRKSRGKFLGVEGAENLETSGGYAKEASEDFKKTRRIIKRDPKKIDIVICTALIPVKKAPIIIKNEMINVMQSGSVIYDLAAAQGGNSELTKVDEIIDNNGVKIMVKNILNKLSFSLKSLRKICLILNNLFDKEKKTLKLIQMMK